MKPKLVVTDESDGCGLAWYFPEDEDIGGRVGDVQHTDADLDAVNEEIRKAADKGTVSDELFEKRENIVITITAAQTKNVRESTYGFVWTTRAAASAALRLINIAIKNLTRDVPWPDWALKASAAGWKPPKNWKP